MVATQPAARASPQQRRWDFVKSFGAQDSIDKMQTIITDIEATAREAMACREDIQAKKRAMDEAKALVLISGAIDGKNAEIRDAQLAMVLKDDAGYQSAFAASRIAQARLDSIEANLATLRDQFTVEKIRTRLVTSTLDFLAAGEHGG